jgi:predicted O-methyltransferase YrrM
MTLTLVAEPVDKYAEDHTEKVPPLFDELRDETYRSMDIPQMQVGRIEGTFLRMLIRLTRARRVLELGMFTGYSALMMAEGLPEDGELITCDVDPKAEAIARKYFAKSPHGKKIRVAMGPALETIKGLKAPIDLVFIDADKVNYSNYFDAVLPLLRANGLIVADNTLWSGSVLEPHDDSGKALAAFNDKVCRDDRVEKVLLTVRDGMMLIRKK